MRTLAVAAVLLFAVPAAAKPWQGIEPGVSKREEIIQKFGEPSRVVTNDDKEIIAYFGKEAIKGTTQAQFKVDAATKVVERIDVFPGPVIDKETIENSYGPACPSGAAARQPLLPEEDDGRVPHLLPLPEAGAGHLLQRGRQDGALVHLHHAEGREVGPALGPLSG